MSNLIEKMVVSPLVESHNPRVLAAMLRLLADAADELPADHICTLAVSEGHDENMHCVGLKIAVTGTPP